MFRWLVLAVLAIVGSYYVYAYTTAVVDPVAIKVQGPDNIAQANLLPISTTLPSIAGRPVVAIVSATNAADAGSAGLPFNSSDSGVSVASASMSFNGASWDRTRTPNVFKPQSAVAVNPEATVWTPQAGKKFRVIGCVIAGSVAGNYTFKDNTAGTTIFIVALGTAGVSQTVDWRNGILSAAANNVLTCTGPAASTLSGTIYGTEE